MEIVHTEIIEPSNWWIALMLLGVSFIILAVSMAFSAGTLFEENGIIIAIGMMGFFLGATAVFRFTTQPIIQHEVLVEDMNVVYDEDYTVIDQRGEIFIISKEYTEETDAKNID